MTKKFRAWFYGGHRADAHARNKRSQLGSGAILVPAHEAKAMGIEVPETDAKHSGPPEFVVAVPTAPAGEDGAEKK